MLLRYASAVQIMIRESSQRRRARRSMENCGYSELVVRCDQTCSKYFLRQLYVSTAVWSTFFVIGQSVGAPTVYIPQLRKEANSTAFITEEMASWLSSASGFAALPNLFALAIASRFVGRRTIFIVTNFFSIIAIILFYTSRSPVQLLISQIFMGINFATSFTNNIILITEYTSPGNRGMFLAIKSTSIICGIWASNAIGTFFHWKCIAYPGIILSLYAFVSLSWPESPYWLASKGRYDDCRKAFVWLYGTNDSALQELECLIEMEKENNRCSKSKWRENSLKTFTKKEFYKPLMICFLLVIQYHFSGKFVFNIYALDIIKKMTENESAAYVGMLVLDGVTVFGMYIGSFLARILKRRTLFFSSSGTGIIFLFLISLYLYLVKVSIIKEHKVVSILLLACYSIPISCGPMTLNSSIYSELIPSRFKSLSVLLTALLFELLLGCTVKVAPLIFRTMGLDGAFLFYGAVTGACFLLLWRYLPETKDKTLTEIEELFAGNGAKKAESMRLYGEGRRAPVAGNSTS